MKILVINPILFTSTDGVLPKVKTIKDTMIYGMCLGFKKLGHEVTLVAMNDYKPTETESYEFQVIFMKSVGTKYLSYALPLSFELWHWLRKHAKDYDMVLSSETFGFHSLFAAIICPKKTIIWQELTAHQRKMHKLPSKFWHNIVCRLFMQKVRCVVPRSDKAYTFISQYMPRVSKTIVDHGINIEKFQCSREKKRQIISSSQLIHRKNVDGIIKKFSLFHKMNGYEDIKLLVAGRGEEENNLKNLVNELGISDAVTFLGFLPQAKLNEYIRSSMAFLVNTRQDLNMVSIPESIVSGTPILTNNVPASAGYISRERLGIAKDAWNGNDIKDIVDHNAFYVDKCIKYRNNLTSEHSAQTLIDIFNNANSFSKQILL